MSSAVPSAHASRSSAAAPSRGRTTSVAAALFGALVRRISAWRNRRAATALLDLDHRLLTDIGLTRHDVIASLRSPSRTPTDDLRRIADERLNTARALARSRVVETCGVAAE
jgi:uncharacterized protein YjiS (DUF1127 family)